MARRYNFGTFKKCPIPGCEYGSLVLDAATRAWRMKDHFSEHEKYERNGERVLFTRDGGLLSRVRASPDRRGLPAGS